MGTIYVQNNTGSTIHVRVTTTGSGNESFFDINSGNSENWDRSDWQVAFVLRDDNNKTETLVVKSGNTYIIS
jgi:predicted extracellular nuclease